MKKSQVANKLERGEGVKALLEARPLIKQLKKNIQTFKYKPGIQEKMRTLVLNFFLHNKNLKVPIEICEWIY